MQAPRSPTINEGATVKEPMVGLTAGKKCWLASACCTARTWSYHHSAAELEGFSLQQCSRTHRHL